MKKGNVLVLGNSGVGKSTLINSVLGDEKAVTGWGTSGTTKELRIYEVDQIPFRLIDSVGFEPSVLKAHQAIGAVQNWAKKSSKSGNEDLQIDLIWFCIDGTSRKLFAKTIKDLSRATTIWKTVPIIAVITKSYSEPDRQPNIEMVQNAFSMQKRFTKNLRKIIPVVAQTYVLNSQAFAPPFGISELIDTTIDLMPEGVQAGHHDIALFKLNRKRGLAHGTVGVATASGTIVAAVPIPYPDAVILTPIELAEVNSIAIIYGLNKHEESKNFIKSIVEVGAVANAAKAAIAILKAIPGINLGAAFINALIAGSIIAALGEGSIYIFEQIYLGNKTMDDIDWVQKVLESKFTTSFVENLKSALADISVDSSPGEIAATVMKLFSASKKA